MYSAGQRHHPVHMHGSRTHGAVGKHPLKRGADGTCAQQTGAPGVHAHDVIFFRPARHQQFDVATLQGFVKGGLGLVGGSTKRGGS
ncbi:hypothetical protein D3C71_2080850 [compost metagenome]